MDNKQQKIIIKIQPKVNLQTEQLPSPKNIIPLPSEKNLDQQVLDTEANIFQSEYDLDKQKTVDKEKSKPIQFKNIEDVLEKLGVHGKYQIIQLIIFCLKTLFYGLFNQIHPYLFNNPEYICGDQVCDQQKWCDYNDTQKTLQLRNFSSLVNEFDILYCDSSIVSLGKSLPYIGTCISILFMTILSDNKGRKIVIQSSWIIATIGCLLQVCYKNLILIYIGFFLTAFGNVSSNVGQVLIMESNTKKQASIYSILIFFTYSIAQMFIWVVTNNTNNWYQISLYFLFIPHCLLNVTSIYYQESPKYKSIRKLPIFTTLLGIGIFQMYYGMQIGFEYIGDNFGQVALIIGISEFFGYLLATYISQKIPRKKGSIILLFLTGFISITLFFNKVPENCYSKQIQCFQKSFIIYIAVFTRFFSCLAVSILTLWINELYPTIIRSMGYGWMKALSMGSCSLSPFIIQFVQKFDINPIAFLGLILIFFSCFGFCLQETFNKEPLQFIETEKNKVQNQYLDKQQLDCITVETQQQEIQQ